MSEKLPKGFDREGAERVLSTSKGEQIKIDLSKRITEIIDEDLSEFFTKEVAVLNMDALKKAGMPHVMLRVGTIQTILDEFRKALEPGYESALREIGEQVGLTFSIDLINFLRKSMNLPLDQEALLEFWAIFDSSADMGKISVDPRIKDNRIQVGIENSFLTKNYEEDKHRHCAFFQGYIRGVVDTSICQWTRWIAETRYAPPAQKWWVESVVKGCPPASENCEFVVNLLEERYPQSRSAFSSSIRSIQQQNYGDASLSARLALERALKEPLGIDDEVPVSFARLLKAYQETQVPLAYSRWLFSYDEISKTAHEVRIVNYHEAIGTILSVKKLLDEWTQISLSEEQRRSLLAKKSEYGIYRKK